MLKRKFNQLYRLLVRSKKTSLPLPAATEQEVAATDNNYKRADQFLFYRHMKSYPHKTSLDRDAFGQDWYSN